MIKRKYIVLIVITSVTLALDQLIKHWVVQNVRPRRPQAIIEGFLYVTQEWNRGAAFSLLSHFPIIFFIIVSIVAILIILYFFSLLGDRQYSLIRALSFVMGGAMGNLWDRIQMDKVVDYVDIRIAGRRGPPFNLADLAISIGVIILIYRMVIKGEEFGDTPKPQISEGDPNLPVAPILETGTNMDELKQEEPVSGVLMATSEGENDANADANFPNKTDDFRPD